MRTVKIILAAALAIFMVASCKDPNFVSRQDYDALMKEYEDLQAGSAAIREEYAQPWTTSSRNSPRSVAARWFSAPTWSAARPR